MGSGHLDRDSSGHLTRLASPNGHLAKCDIDDVDCVGIDCEFCYCCSPAFYKVVISGGTGACTAVNGTFFLEEIADGVFERENDDVIITLTLTTRTCRIMTLTVTEKATSSQCFQATDTLDIGCVADSVTSGFTWAVCPAGVDPTPDIIEVTFAGVNGTKCTECRTNGTLSWDSVAFSLDGTFSLTRAGLCDWTFSLVPEQATIRAYTNTICSGLGIGQSGFIRITVELFDASLNVHAEHQAGVPTFARYPTFDANIFLLSPEPRCRKFFFGISNALTCGVTGSPTTVPMASGGIASVNFAP